MPLTDERRAEIVKIADERAYWRGSGDRETVAIRDLLAENERLTRELADCHSLFREIADVDSDEIEIAEEIKLWSLKLLKKHG